MEFKYMTSEDKIQDMEDMLVAWNMIRESMRTMNCETCTFDCNQRSFGCPLIGDVDYEN